MNLAKTRFMFSEARKLGFVDVFRGKATKYCPSVCELRVARGDRFLRLQFCGNGKHTLSHGKIGEYGDHQSLERDGIPTEFTNVCEMYRAIAFHWQRAET